MRALVVGASGFIGGAIARAALERGDDVVGLVREGRAVPQGIERAIGSALDPNAIAHAAQGADVIYHAVGTLDPTLPPAVYHWLYVSSTENVVAAARHAEVSRLVLISSSDVTLAEEDRVHWDEKRELGREPIGARAQAIRLGEDIALASSDDTLSVVALRPGWVWGKGDTSRLPSLIREAKSGGLRMYGEGRNLLSTTHVDVVSAAALAAARVPGAAGQAYYLTDVELLELRELFRALSESLGLPPPVSGMPGALASLLARSPLASRIPREELVLRRFSTHFNAEKARTELGIEPTITLEEGMKGLSSWVKSRGGADALLALVRKPPTVAELQAEADAGLGESPSSPREGK